MPETINLRDTADGAVIRIECGASAQGGIVATLETLSMVQSNRWHRLGTGDIVHVDSGSFRYYVRAWKEELCDECHDLKSGCTCAVLVPA